MLYRRPGPGARILREVKREYAELLAKANAIFIDGLRNAGLYDETSQAFARLVNCCSNASSIS